MTYQETIQVLKIHQEWRLGAEFPQTVPRILTQAIDIILIQERYTKQEFLDAAKMGEVSMIDARHVVSLLDEVRENNNL